MLRQGITALAVSLTLVAPAMARAADDPVTTVAGERVARYVPKKAGTQEQLRVWYGPYLVPPGHDANRFDLELPIRDGFVTTIEPGMRRVEDLSEPGHQEAHIHHAHWFALDPGNEHDNYFGGLMQWAFGNGDEETRADSTERTAAEPGGPIYGGALKGTQPQVMIYMLHNKTSRPLNVYIALDVTFVHGTLEELGPRYHSLTGTIFGKTYDVAREPAGDGTKETAIEWTSTMEGTMIGAGGHLHPGGLRVEVENLGSDRNPCRAKLLDADALWRDGVPFSEDFQMEVSHPAWRAPIRKGDRLRITGIYENRDHAWYDVMTHMGMYVDPQQKPRAGCAPYLVGATPQRHTAVRRRRHVHYRISRRGRLVRRVHWHRRAATAGVDPVAGVPNRPWGHHKDLVCGLAGGAACDRPEKERPPGRLTNEVTIADFLYLPGDQSLAGEDGAPPRVRHGEALTFVNADQAAGIRHSVTTCAWPCNGPYVGNYPLADGTWDSGTLGYDVVDGGSPNPVARTPPDLAVGRYAYFCRIHPWMRGAFEVV
jgi:hypothetical protein